MGDSEISKIEGEVEMKSSREKVFSVIAYEQHHVPNASSDNIHHVAVHEGAWESCGSVKLWKYTVDGVPEEFKEKIEVDEEANTVTLTAIEGHVLDLYKTYKSSFRVTPKSEEEGCLVKITIEYQTVDDSVPPPTKYLNFLTRVVQDIDGHLLKP